VNKSIISVKSIFSAFFLNVEKGQVAHSLCSIEERRDRSDPLHIAEASFSCAVRHWICWSRSEV